MQLWQIELIRLNLSTAFSLMLARRSYQKLSQPIWFALVLRNYCLLPPPLIPFVCRFLPAVELALAAGLILDISRPWPMLATSALLAGFAVAVMINLLRGLRDIICDCFGPGSALSLSWGLMARNLGLAGLAVVASQLPVCAMAQGPQRLRFQAAAIFIVLGIAASIMTLRGKFIRRGTRAARGTQMPALPPMAARPIAPTRSQFSARRRRFVRSRPLSRAGL
jgi:hypothetical protein